MTHEEYLSHLARRLLKRERFTESGSNEKDAVSRWLAREIALVIKATSVAFHKSLQAKGLSGARPPQIHRIQVRKRWDPPQSSREELEVRYSVEQGQQPSSFRIMLYEIKNNSFSLRMVGKGDVIRHSRGGVMRRLASGRFQIMAPPVRAIQGSKGLALK